MLKLALHGVYLMITIDIIFESSGETQFKPNAI